jgi:hypothetical protein
MEYSDMSSATPSPCRSPQCTHSTSSCSSYQPQHNYGQQQQQQQRKPVLVDRGTSASNVSSAQLPPSAAGAASSSSSTKKGEGAYTDFDADFDRSHRSPHQGESVCPVVLQSVVALLLAYGMQRMAYTLHTVSCMMCMLVAVLACSRGHALCFLPQSAECLKHCNHSLRNNDVVVVQTATYCY